MIVARVLLPLLCLWALASALPAKNSQGIKYMEHLTLTPSLMRHTARRAIDNEEITLNFRAYNRDFTLNLKRNDDLFADGVQVVAEGSDSTEIVDMSNVAYYLGRITTETSRGSFRVGVDGKIRGALYTRNDMFNIEPAEHFYDGPTTFDHIIYKHSDTDYNAAGIIDAEVVGPMLDAAEAAENVHHRDRRAGYVTNKDTCQIALISDYLFYTNNGHTSIGLAVDAMVELFQVAQDIFAATTFTKPVKISVGYVKVYTSASNPLALSGTPTAEQFLNAFSALDWSAYCLAHGFTYRNFNGVLGLAWRGYTNSENRAGGICQARLSGVSYNSAITTANNFGSAMSTTMTGLVVTHEIGHNIGSGHDSTSTTYPNGNYIMYPNANDGSKSNNDLFSPASISAISAVVEDKGGCFVTSGSTTCGNTFVEGTEQCDCGDASTCAAVDTCCNVFNPSVTANNCKLKNPSGCTPLKPRDGACCTSGCTKQPAGTQCAPAGECTLAAQCDASGACPTSGNKPDNTVCQSSTKVCSSGSCSVSVCSLYGLTECELTSSKCNVGCLEGGVCMQVGSLTTAHINPPGGYTKADTPKVNGATCAFKNNDPTTGFCDAGSCVSASGESELQDTLNDLADKAKEGFSTAVNWAMQSTSGVPNWGWLLIGLGILLIIGAAVNRYRDKLEAQEDAEARNKKRNQQRAYEMSPR